MSAVLLEHNNLQKKLFNSRILKPGVVTITRGMIKGTTEGDYLNIYNDLYRTNKDTPYKRFDEYYSGLLDLIIGNRETEIGLFV